MTLGPQFTQGQLFDTYPYEQEKAPGQMSLDEWMSTQDPVFHGTFRQDFPYAPTAHYGTMGAAVKALHNVGGNLSSPLQAARYFDPSIDELPDDYDEDYSDPGYTGAVYARRLVTPPRSVPYSDMTANAADLAYRVNVAGEELFEVPRSIKSSIGEIIERKRNEEGFDEVVVHPGSKVEQGFKDLEQDVPIAYKNELEKNPQVDALYPYGPKAHMPKSVEEDKNTSFSIVAPRKAVTSWERDVLADPKASIFAQQFAQQRIDQGKEGAVPFPNPNAPAKEIPGYSQSRLTVNSGELKPGPPVIVPELPEGKDERLDLTTEYWVPKG